MGRVQSALLLLTGHLMFVLLYFRVERKKLFGSCRCLAPNILTFYKFQLSRHNLPFFSSLFLPFFGKRKFFIPGICTVLRATKSFGVSSGFAAIIIGASVIRTCKKCVCVWRCLCSCIYNIQRPINSSIRCAAVGLKRHRSCTRETTTFCNGETVNPFECMGQSQWSQAVDWAWAEHIIRRK